MSEWISACTGMDAAAGSNLSVSLMSWDSLWLILEPFQIQTFGFVKSGYPQIPKRYLYQEKAHFKAKKSSLPPPPHGQKLLLNRHCRCRDRAVPGLGGYFGFGFPVDSVHETLLSRAKT